MAGLGRLRRAAGAYSVVCLLRQNGPKRLCKLQDVPLGHCLPGFQRLGVRDGRTFCDVHLVPAISWLSGFDSDDANHPGVGRSVLSM